MKNEELYEVLSDINEDYVNQAHQAAQKKPKSACRRWIPLAACLGLIVVALGILWASSFEGKPSLESTIEDYTSNPTTSTVPHTSGSNGSNGQGQNNTSPGEPPPMVIFRDEEALEELIAAAALPDDELEAYLAEQGYAWERMGSRSALDRFLEPFRLLGYPDVPTDIIDEIFEWDGITKRKGFSVEYYPDRGYSDVEYRINGIRYRFLVKMDGEVIDRTGMEKVGTYAIEDQEFILYISTDGDALVGEVYYENLRIRIIVQYYEHIEDVSFEPFFWHKVETNPVKEGFPYEIVAICAVAVAVAGTVAVVIRRKRRAAE